MKRLNICSLVLLGVLVIGVASTAVAAGSEQTRPGQITIYVDDDFNDDAANHKWNTIQEAIGDAQGGDTVIVYEGTYKENVVVNKPITLKGQGIPVVDGAQRGSGITISADGCTVEGFKVLGSGPDAEDAGIKVLSDNNTIRNNNASKNRGNGITLSESSSGNTIEGNITSENGRHGIYLWRSSDNTIKSTTSNNNTGAGIRLEYSSRNILEGNDANYNGENGIYIGGVSQDEASGNFISSNNVSNNSYDGIYLEYSRSNTIEGNIASNNSGRGIFLDASPENIIRGNTCIENEVGIWLSYSSGNTLESNHVVANNYGIHLRFSSNNAIKRNTVSANWFVGIFLENSSDNLAFHNNLDNSASGLSGRDYRGVNSWDNGVEGNYWGDYNGVDGDADGIGDTTHEVPGGAGAKDNHPLMQPFVLGDVNRDSKIDVFDLVSVAAIFSAIPQAYSRADVNEDSIVNVFDLVLVGINFSKTSSVLPNQ